jgi:hypothetical protein
MRALAFALLAAAAASPALARDSLGMFGSWGAFRDPQVPRCYAIAMADTASGARAEQQAYAGVSHWPRRGLRNQVHFRLSKRVPANASLRLTVGTQPFALRGAGGDAWTADRRIDAAVVAAIRSAETMRVSGRGADGRGFSDRYPLAGAASAIDAAALGCARSR